MLTSKVVVKSQIYNNKPKLYAEDDIKDDVSIFIE